MNRLLLFATLLVTHLSAEPLRIHIGPTREIKTPRAAADHLAEIIKQTPARPIEIILDAGRYELSETLTLGPQHGGTETAPVTWRSANEQKAVISGARQIQGFVANPDGTWKLQIPDNLHFEQLWINGQRAIRSRHPNQGTLPITKITEEKLENTHRQTATLDPVHLAAFTQTGKTDGLQILVYHKWDNTRRAIETLDPKTGVFSTIGSEMKSWNRWDDQSGVVFENSRALLDAPGEWFLENKQLTYVPRPGETPETTTARIPVLGKLLEIQGTPEKTANHIHWQNIEFSGTGWNTPPTGFDPQQAAATIGAAIETSYSTGIIFRQCIITATAHYGIWFRKGSSNGLVEETQLHDLGAGALRAGEMNYPTPGDECHSHRFHKNTIRNAGITFPCAVGIWIGHSPDNQITRNSISRLPYSGISLGWRWGYDQSAAKRNLVSHNHIHHIGDGELSDMGAVYTLGPSEGTIVSNNHIHHITSKTYGGWGLYTDEGSTGIIMENNLVHHTKSGGFHQHYGKDNIIRNNIFAYATEQQLQFTRVEEHLSFEFTRNIVLWESGPLLASNGWNGKFRMNHNLYWKTDGSTPGFLKNSLAEWRAEGHDTDSLIADPGFTDPKNGNFTPTNTQALQKIGFKPFATTVATD